MTQNPPRLVRNTVIVLLATMVFACGSLFLKPEVLFRPVVEDLHVIPKIIGFWVGTDIDPGPSARALPNSSVLMRRYSDLTGNEFILTIVCGLDLADMHKPEYCLEGTGWRTKSSRSVEVTAQSGDKYRARLLRVRTPDSRELSCLYWFAGPRGSTDVLAERKWDVMREVILSGRLQPTALVRITAPISKDPALIEDQLLLVAGALEGHLDMILQSAQ